MRYLLSILILLTAATVAAQNTDDAHRGWLRHKVPGGSSTFTGDITLENDETISNSTDGFLCFGGSGGTSDEDLCLDLDGTNLVNITTNTGVLLVDFGTINLATDALDLSEGSITNVSDIALDSITADAMSGGITMGGTGTVSTESLLWKYGETSDQIDISSASGATRVDWGTLDHYGSDLSLSGNVTLEGGGSIVTTSNGDINLAPNGTGAIVLGGNLTLPAAGVLQFGSLTKADSGAGPTDGHFRLMMNSGQGILLNLTVADTATLTDELGNAFRLNAATFGATTVYTTSVRSSNGIATDLILEILGGGTAANGKPITIRTGLHSGTGDYDSGGIDIDTGGSTTLGESGPITGTTGTGAVNSGVIGWQTGDGGSGAAGDFYVNTDGANRRLTIDGEAGVMTLTEAPVFADYTRHHDVPIGAAIVGAAAPGVETIGTFRCYVFDANADLAHISVEVPPEWNGSSDMAIDLLIFTDNGDALGNGEVIEFDLVYRSVDEGQAYDNGAAVTIEATVTGGGAETDKGQYKITATVDYDHGDQPLATNDTIGFSIMRDVDDSDTYSGDVHVCRSQLVYSANTLATH